jgi:glycosyltransferase involved in cell wall biosynthesis
MPTYRHEKTIQEDILSVHSAMSNTGWDFEIIPVIDGFIDGSFEEAKKVKKSNVHVVGYRTNHGKGYAVRYGMARAKGDLIAFIDAGMDINPTSLSMVLEHMKWYNADIIVGSKRHLASKVKYSTIRKIYSWGYYFIVKILFGLKLTDTQTGLKVFKRRVLEKVLPRLTIKEFAFDIELLVVAWKLGFKEIYEAPVDVNLDFTKESKFKRGFSFFLDPNIRGILYDTIAVFYRLKVLRYYDDNSRRRWVYDKELDMRVNTGETYE